MLKKSYLLLFLLPLLSFQCESNWEDPTQGLRPVYAPTEPYDKILLLPPRSLTNQAKIYVFGIYIFAIEQGEGVHIINNSDPANPVNIHFLRIFGCNDLSIRGNMMYIDNFTDLITIDFSRIDSPVVVNRLPNFYQSTYGSGEYPEDYHGYFECVDSSKGRVLTWKESALDNPKCRR